MMSSVTPSLKNSLSGSALMFANGSTAIDCSCALPPAPPLAIPATGSASTTSAPVENRSSGAFASSRDHASDGGGNRRTHRGDVGRRVNEALRQYRLTFPPVNGGSPVEHLVEHAAQREEIAPSVDVLPRACSGLM